MKAVKAQSPSTLPCPVRVQRSLARSHVLLLIVPCPSRPAILANLPHQTCNSALFIVHCSSSSSSFLPGDMRHKAMVGGGNPAFFESVSIEGIEGLRGDQFMGPWDLRRMPGCPLTSLYDVLFLEFWWRACCHVVGAGAGGFGGNHFGAVPVGRAGGGQSFGSFGRTASTACASNFSCVFSSCKRS